MTLAEKKRYAEMIEKGAKKEVISALGSILDLSKRKRTRRMSRSLMIWTFLKVS